MCCSALTDEQSSKTRMKNGGVPAMMWEFSVLDICCFQLEFEMWDMKGQHDDRHYYF